MFLWIRNHKVAAAVIAAVLILAVVIAVSYFNGNGFIGKGVNRANAAAAAPVSSFVSGVRDGIKGLFGFRTLMRENEALQDEVNALRRENMRIRLEEKELEELRELANVLNYESVSDSYHFVAASVVAMDNSRCFSSFTINAGTESGISENAIVLSGNGLVGRVSETGNGYAKVVSVIDDHVNVSFQVARDMTILGVVTGDGNSALKGYTLNGEAGIVEGDILLSTGIGMYPEGIEIGRTTSVVYNSDAQLMTIEADPFVDFRNLRKVVVLTQ